MCFIHQPLPPTEWLDLQKGNNKVLIRLAFIIEEGGNPCDPSVLTHEGALGHSQIGGWLVSRLVSFYPLWSTITDSNPKVSCVPWNLEETSLTGDDDDLNESPFCLSLLSLSLPNPTLCNNREELNISRFVLCWLLFAIHLLVRGRLTEAEWVGDAYKRGVHCTPPPRGRNIIIMKLCVGCGFPDTIYDSSGSNLSETFMESEWFIGFHLGRRTWRKKSVWGKWNRSGHKEDRLDKIIKGKERDRITQSTLSSKEKQITTAPIAESVCWIIHRDWKTTTCLSTVILRGGGMCVGLCKDSKTGCYDARLVGGRKVIIINHTSQ